jgi:hypothetical protein
MSSFVAAPGAAAAGPPILLVDDEVPVLDGLPRKLLGNYAGRGDLRDGSGGCDAPRT